MFAVLKKYRSLSYKMKAEGQKRGKKENVQGATTAKKDGSVNRSTWRISPMLCSKYDFFAFPHRCQSVSLNVIFRLYSTKRRDPKFSSAFCTMHGCSWCRPIAPHSANIFFFLPPPPFFGKTCTRQPRGVVKKKKKLRGRLPADHTHHCFYLIPSSQVSPPQVCTLSS